MDWFNIAYLVLAFYFGGVLKGATGAGAPIIAIPIISLLYDVPTAVAAIKSLAYLLGHLRALACLGQQLGQPS